MPGDSITTVGPAFPAGLIKPIGKVENRWEEYRRMWASNV